MISEKTIEEIRVLLKFIKLSKGEVGDVSDEEIKEYISKHLESSMLHYRNENGEIKFVPAIIAKQTGVNDYEEIDGYFLKYTKMMGKPYVELLVDGQLIKAPASHLIKLK